MPEPRRAIVVGGSFGGLTAALLLREQGFEVDLFERTPALLDGRGGRHRAPARHGALDRRASRTTSTSRTSASAPR